MRLKAIKDIDEYKLCFVDNGCAWFTKLPLKDKRGSDWEDVPYEHNADPPDGEDVMMVMYIAPDFREPSYGHVNSPYSVDVINSGVIPWLRLRSWDGDKEISKENIYGGCPLKEFIRIIQKHGGKIYLQIENI